MPEKLVRVPPVKLCTRRKGEKNDTLQSFCSMKASIAQVAHTVKVLVSHAGGHGFEYCRMRLDRSRMYGWNTATGHFQVPFKMVVGVQLQTGCSSLCEGKHRQGQCRRPFACAARFPLLRVKSQSVLLGFGWEGVGVPFIAAKVTACLKHDSKRRQIPPPPPFPFCLAGQRPGTGGHGGGGAAFEAAGGNPFGDQGWPS